MKTLDDLTEAAPIKRKILEGDVQKKSVDWARARGYWARKFSSQSQRSVPDYLFALQQPYIPRWTAAPLIKFACEFKAPGKRSTEAQLEEQQLMRTAGWFVFECDSFERFKYIVGRLERGEVI